MRKSRKNLQFHLLTYVELILSFLAVTFIISAVLENKGNTYSSDETLILTIFVILSLFVTALGMIGIQLIQVYRKKVEISLKRSVGATDLDIVVIIFKSTLLFILFPAIIGCILGAIISSTNPLEIFYFQTQVDYRLYPLCILSILIFTVLSALPPAIRAVRINILDGFKNSISTERNVPSKGLTLLFYCGTLSILSTGLFLNYRTETAYHQDQQNTAGPPPASSEQVPDFSFITEDGTITSSADLLGTSYILFIYDATCPVTSEVFHNLITLTTEDSINADIYPVCIDHPLIEAKKYLGLNKLSLPLFVDNDKSTKWAFNVSRVPAIYLVNQKGMITARSIGWSDNVSQYISKALRN